jgi:hypothetical protein
MQLFELASVERVVVERRPAQHPPATRRAFSDGNSQLAA